MPLSVERKITVGFAIALIVIALIGVGSYRSTTRLVSNAERVSHTQDVIETIETVLSLTKDIETGQRGYIITGERRFLAPYEVAGAPLRGAVIELRRLTGDNPEQQARVDRLDSLVARRLSIAARTLDVRTREGFDAAREEILENPGAAIMDELRMVAADMKRHERLLLAERDARVESSARSTVLVLVCGVLVAFVTVAVAGVRIRQDLAARQRDAQLMRASEEKFRGIMESAPDAMLIIDRAGRIVLANTEAERVFGYERAELIGQPVELLVPTRSRHRHPTLRQGFFDRPIVRPMGAGLDLRGLRKDGTEFPIEIRLSPLPTEGEPVVTSVVRDVTDRRQVQEELRQAKDDAEAASRAKSDFLANMSHEIRTPMNGIIGMTELALHQDLPPPARRHLTMVKTSADALLRVINDILDFSKIEAGKLALEAADFTLRESLGDTVQALAVQAHGKGLELAVRIEPDVPDALVGDPDRLRQIVVNLVGNAIKFTDEGEVVVGVRLREHAVEAALLEISVADSGIGIPAEKHRAIFESFEQADASTTRQYGGTGLGLAISAQLVQMMGGKIWVESEPGKGSTFRFTARFGVQRVAATRARAADPTQLHGLKVLVVDDNDTNRRILDETLREWEMRPTALSGAADAMQELARARDAGDPFRLILVDSRMPEVDGFELAQRIRSTSDLAMATIMMLTSDDRAGDATRCRAIGIESYLVKPVKQSALRDAILTALGAAPPPSEEADAPAAAAARGVSLRLLLVEDNLINQALAVELLEPRGHRVTVVGNGRDALHALASERFDAVLMDVQMPEMDGFEAVRRLRQRERGTGRRMPVIAMTAHAMKGDEERCRQAGMDGYVSKPIHAPKLYAALEQVVPRPRVGSGRQTITPTTGVDMPAGLKPTISAGVEVHESSTAGDRGADGASEVTLDVDAILDRISHNRTLLARLIEMFVEESPKLVAAIQEALAKQDRPALRRAAHSLRGSAAIFESQEVCALAQEIEELAETDADLGPATGKADALAYAVDRLKPALTALVS